MLGLEEGEARLTCPPGTKKVHLAAWPWQKCVPEGEILAPGSEIAPAARPLRPQPSMPVPVAPVSTEPRKARFLKVDPITDQIVDPDTNLPIEVESAFLLTPVETAATAGVAIGITALLLVVFGVFK